MAARTTHSASRKARAAEAVATGPLGALSHDELGVIVDGLADPLRPVIAVAFSSTCLGLRTPLGAALEVLAQQHTRAKALCHKAGRNDEWLPMSCAELSDEVELDWSGRNLTADDMATLGVILAKSLPRLRSLAVGSRFAPLGDAGIQALCEGLVAGAAPSLCELDLEDNRIGPAGADALAAALRRGALPKLKQLHLTDNPLGNLGAAALAAPLRTKSGLTGVHLEGCLIGDEGVASLVANLGKDDFKTLEVLDLENNEITDAGMATLIAAIKAAMPAISELELLFNPASDEARQSVEATLLAERPILQYEPAEDVEALMARANASRFLVVQALRNNNGDMALALRALEKLPDPGHWPVGGP